MGGQIPVIQRTYPQILVINDMIGISLPHDGFGAVQFREALLNEVLPGCFPCQFHAKFKSLDCAVPHGIAMRIPIFIDSVLEPCNSLGKMSDFCFQIAHKGSHLPFRLFAQGPDPYAR